MTKTFEKYALLFLLTLVIMFSFSLTACKKEEATTVANDVELSVVMLITEDVPQGETLLDYMNKLKDRGEIDFAIENGMVTSINGTKNSDKYWMLYTSDADNSNPAWGIFEHGGKECGSASFGADKLPIKEDELYIWAYKAVN